MDSEQISFALRNIAGFSGVYPCDKLCDLATRAAADFSLVVNTDPSTRVGRHWVAIVVRAGVCHVFCSLGEEPRRREIVSFCRRFTRCLYNAQASQSPSEVTCAAYALMVIREMSRNVSFGEIVHHFHTICDDDSHVREYIKEHFGLYLL